MKILFGAIAIIALLAVGFIFTREFASVIDVTRKENIAWKDLKREADSLNLVLLKTINNSSHAVYHKRWMDSVVIISVTYFPINKDNPDTSLVAYSLYPASKKGISTKVKRLSDTHIAIETIWPRPTAGFATYKFVVKNKATGETIGFPSFLYDSNNANKKMRVSGKVFMESIRE